MSEYSTFARFSSEDQASGLVQLLQKHGIEHRMERNRFGADFLTGNGPYDDTLVMLLPGDFDRANRLLEEQAAEAAREIDEEHYLRQFDTGELLEVVQNPYEWSSDDVLLARALLKERGTDLSREELDRMKAGHLRRIREGEQIGKAWIWFGYLSALSGGIIGLLMGWYYSSLKKLDPEGKRMYVYNASTRRAGSRIFVAGLIGTAVWILLFLLKGWYYSPAVLYFE
jgi:hypothetical protein